MSNKILEVKDLHISAGEKEILKGIDLVVNQGEVHVIMGPNGAGKSTLGYAIMGNPEYTVTDGKIVFNDEDITDLSADKRALKGIFLSFQNPPEVQGLEFGEFLHTATDKVRGQKSSVWYFNKEVKGLMDFLKMNNSYTKRDLNYGFSGGEKKKAEIVQLLMLKPKLAILDETDSGLDVDAVRAVSQGIAEYMKTYNGTCIIITHSTRILESIDDYVTHIIANGKVIKTAGKELVEEVNAHGFEQFIK